MVLVIEELEFWIKTEKIFSPGSSTYQLNDPEQLI